MEKILYALFVMALVVFIGIIWYYTATSYIKDRNIINSFVNPDDKWELKIIIDLAGRENIYFSDSVYFKTSLVKDNFVYFIDKNTKNSVMVYGPYIIERLKK